ncbi:biopolymer transporter ExbD [Pseudoalteromonas sp. MIP2626]|uniref:ExbD/TolR family protein n=1 Tax=Pseudoalteromonas sp. MIP2626 TaxID=2705464 RepID=UPI0015C8621A|nr:biopolymer transporter ExbD [Pseudoalteromonas sp. MIP2626]NYR14223.1 biopolymer transporter ExbD [Pseudoalteromonas sp. MIP2626]
MIKVSHHRASTSLTPDLTPLLDIIFIVMVFLLLTASVRLESLDVDLPSSDSQVVSEVDNKSLTINILNESPHWAIDGIKFSDWNSFTLDLLEETTPNKKPIVIGAEKTADIQHLVKLLAFLQEHGIPATQLLTEDK